MGRKDTPEFVEICGEAKLETGSQTGEEKEGARDDPDRTDRIREIREIRWFENGDESHLPLIGSRRFIFFGVSAISRQ